MRAVSGRRARRHRGGFVRGHDSPRGSLLANLAAVDPQHTLAKPANLVHLVTDKNNGAPGFRYFFHLAEAFFLKFQVAYGQDFVHK